MPRHSYGSDIQKRVWSFVELLLSYAKAESEGCAHVKGIRLNRINWHNESSARPELEVWAELNNLTKLPNSNLGVEDIREALSYYLPVFLEVLEDKRQSKQGKGSKNWHFTLKLWHTDLQENQRWFDWEWECRKSGKAKDQEPLVLYPEPLPAKPQAEQELATTEKIRADLRQSLREHKRYGRFIGRENYLNQVLTAIEDPDANWIIAIDGIGGMGKTALAHTVVNRLLDAGSFYAAVWESAQHKKFSGASIQQQSTNEIDFDRLLTQIACKLGFVEVLGKRTTEQKREVVRHILGSQRYLVVIDNLETINEYRDLVENLDGLFTHSKAILTTRKQIADILHIYPVQLRGMEPEESFEFLRSFASGRGKAGDVIRFASEQTLDKIHRITGGLPLAMELVVGQATRFSLDTVLTRLQTVNYKNIEQSESAEDVYKQFYGFIYWDAWEQLSDKAKQMLISLGTFDVGKGAERDDLVFVSELEGIALDYAAEELIVCSLVYRNVQEDGQETFSLHPLTHRFVRTDLVGG